MNLDYLNLNSVRNYPLKDDCSRVSLDGLFVIPNSLIVDMSLCSSQLGDIPNLYISRLACSNSSLSIEISANGYGVFGSFQSALPLSSTYPDISLSPNSALFPSATGLITLGSSDDLAGLPNGDFHFSYASTALLMRVFSPGISGLSWLSFTDTLGNASTLTGNVQIQGRSNLQFKTAVVGGSPVVYMLAGENLGLNKVCDSPNKCITSINGVTPDQTTGNFTLMPGTCVTIDDIQYGLVLGNPCGQPCLGCTAVNQLTTQVNGLEGSLVNIKTFIDNLQAAIAQASTLITYTCQCS